MKKRELENMNAMAMYYWAECGGETNALVQAPVLKKLRSCNAAVYETENFYVLVSYNTAIACIHKQDKVLVDMLRYAYGYTSTSSQHVSKFGQDYGATIGGVGNCLTWRPL